ncbi:MAG: thioredoxin family protein [Bacteroidia bacterium]
METLTALTQIKLNGVMSFEEYFTYVQDLAGKNQTSGETQSEERIAATKLNAQRMRRLRKQTVLQPGLVRSLSAVKHRWEWVLIVESWCGDGAQNLPVLAKMTELVPDKINLKVVLRDANIELIDAHLTNNARAVPKLICFNRDTKSKTGTWGPRPAVIQERVRVLKLNTNLSHDEFVHTLHTWYADDKTASLQNEFEELIKSWNQ